AEASHPTAREGGRPRCADRATTARPPRDALGGGKSAPSSRVRHPLKGPAPQPRVTPAPSFLAGPLRGLRPSASARRPADNAPLSCMTEDEQRAYWKTVPIVAIYLQTEHVRFPRAPRREYSRVFRDHGCADRGRSMHRTQPRRNRLAETAVSATPDGRVTS